MQASLAIPGSLDLSNRSSSGEFDEFAKLSQDFSRKVHVNRYVSIAEEEEKPEIEHHREPEDDDPVVVEESEEEEEEFSFATAILDGSPEEVEFHDGQIRLMYPIFDQSLLYAVVEGGDSGTSASSPRPRLKKLFVEERDDTSSSEAKDFEGAAAGEYCEWSRKVVEASPGTCRKSNSTGFSKIWRFRDLVRRSSSDGKDAFVFLSSDQVSTKKVVAAKEVTETTGGDKVKVKVRKTTPSAHELHYVKNRKEDKRRTYLPYRQGLVGYGFFTSVNGLTKNVHPY